MTRTIARFVPMTLLLVGSTALAAQKPHPAHPASADSASIAAMMGQLGTMQQHMSMMTSHMMSGQRSGMGAMSGMMGGASSHRTMSQMAGQITQMLAVMQGYTSQMQAPMSDSAVARDPEMVENVDQLRRHMASMIASMAPMIGTMQQMQEHMGMSGQTRHQ